jgi:hypothetical protein
MHSDKDIPHEPTNIAPEFPSVRPGDLVLTLHEHKKLQLQACAIDFSMVSTPDEAANATQQQRKNKFDSTQYVNLRSGKECLPPQSNQKAPKKTNIPASRKSPSHPQFHLTQAYRNTMSSRTSTKTVLV